MNIEFLAVIGAATVLALGAGCLTFVIGFCSVWVKDCIHKRRDKKHLTKVIYCKDCVYKIKDYNVGIYCTKTKCTRYSWDFCSRADTWDSISKPDTVVKSDN